MKTKYVFTLISLLLITNIFAQSSLNDYKYVIVPKKFDFLKTTDGYQVNSLTKFLLEKENFIVFFEDNLPAELDNNRCLALYTDVLNDSGMFKTKLNVRLKNCKNEIVFDSRIGISREKEYKKAYHEALRNAFQSFKSVNYVYQPKQVEQGVVEVKPKVESVVVVPVLKETPKVEVVNKPTVVEPTKEEIKISNIEKPKEVVEVNEKILIAKWVGIGFKVLDENSKEVMVLYMTASEEVYIVKGKDAIVSKNKNGFWVYSENDGTNLMAKVINLKF